MTAAAVEGCVNGMFGRPAVLPLRVTESGQHCVTCHGRVPHHGGDVQRLSAYYTCVWCGAQLKKNTAWTHLKHERWCAAKPTEPPCVCGDPCSECHQRACLQGPTKVYVRCRHLYCSDCDPKKGVIPLSCGNCTKKLQWWDETWV
jgi:hypothetical protein